MRVNRLVIESGDNTLGVDFHERLTVIAGVGRLEREGLINELIGSMSSARSGVHLEFTDSRQRHLAVFRPSVGKHRVIDTDNAADVTDEFTSRVGIVDVLGRDGVDARTARKVMRLSSDQLRTGEERDDAVQQLATVDQTRLWKAAERMMASENHLQHEADAVGSVPEDVEIIEKIEERHHAYEQAIEHHEHVRKAAFGLGGASGIVGTIATVMVGPIGLLALVVGLGAAIASIVFRRRMDEALVAEEQALEEAGAASYLGFHLQRVNGLLADDGNRKRLMDAAEGSRGAQKEWEAVAGGITVDFAYKHKDAIDAAAQVRRNVDSLDTMSSTTPSISRDQATDLAQVLVQRLTEARGIGKSDPNLPLVLDEPFTEVDPSVKPLLLELLSTTAGNPQVIFLTQDEDVASWARLEALTGDVSIIEPTPESESSRVEEDIGVNAY